MSGWSDGVDSILTEKVESVHISRFDYMAYKKIFVVERSIEVYFRLVS